jgi:hypothetical protein
MRKTFSTNTTDSGGHAAVFYEKPAELWRLLAEYFHTGFDQNELGILVTKFTPKQVLSSLKLAGLDVSHRISKGDLRIFNMEDTYLPGGLFVADFMMKNVLNFIEDAHTQGYNGLRTAGEMNWLHDHPDSQAEAEVYEKGVNETVDQHPEFTGICLYAMQQGQKPATDLKAVLDRHPSYFYDGELHGNPAFQPS